MTDQIDQRTIDQLGVLGGRSSIVASRGFHLWGSIEPGAQWTSWANPVLGGDLFRPCGLPGGLFQVSATASEYRRVNRLVGLLPLAEEAITQTPPGVTPATARTVMQLACMANDGVDTRMWFMDANQSVVVCAQNVCVRWMGPPDTRDVSNLPTATRETLRRFGLCIDSFLGVSVTRIEGTPGSNSECCFTNYLSVAANTRGVIEIPPYAQRLTIYQEPTQGTASVAWTFTLGDPNGVSGFEATGALPFIAGLRRTQQESVVGNSSHLWTDTDPDFARFFTLRWTIRP